MHIKQILDFVDKAPWGKNTMVIITADHGEAFGEHKQYLHAFEIWHHLTNVPLIIRAPGLTPRRIDEPRSMIDLCPTILETFSVAPDTAFRGKSLWPELRGGPAEPRDVITELAKDSNNEHRRALLRGDWKIIESGRKKHLSLFNIKDDRAEEKNLVIEEKAKFKEMREALKAAASQLKEIQM
jgi:arylsulfatase A-like enzyme